MDNSSQVNNTEVVKDEKKELEEEYHRLVNRVNSTARQVVGCGDRGQCYIDTEYRKLKEFCSKHKEFKLPPCPKSYDDGTGGFASGLAVMAKHMGIYQ